ncbi:MAG TPA: hypothetical protein PLF26_13220 [Blastocatellia bacterium]|nr:hypothetical protein [Blastocatellia bacterium]
MTFGYFRRAAARAAALFVLSSAIAGLGAFQGCRSVSSAPRPLVNAQASPDDLARRFLDCLARHDVESMKALRITKDEFCRYVFPELPASRTPNVSCDWVWDQATLKSMAGMTRMLDDNGSANYEFVSMSVASTERHETYAVLKNPVVTVRDATGSTRDVRLFGSVLELDGQYKLFSFVVD